MATNKKTPKPHKTRTVTLGSRDAVETAIDATKDSANTQWGGCSDQSRAIRKWSEEQPKKKKPQK